MKIISWNVNGLRAVYKRNFLSWLENSGADVVCLQEVKATEETVPPQTVNPPPYSSYFNFAVKKGYSGVAVYTKEKPLAVKNSLGLKRFDEEGRLLQLEYPTFTLFNLYIPHGGREKENLNYKLEVYKYLLSLLRKVKDKPLLLIGDFNIAHTDLDLARPKQNSNNIMFTPKERQQIDALLALGFVDCFRTFYNEGGHYTWWPYFANARQHNLGWRIDYAFASKIIHQKLQRAAILKEITGSDHCPIAVELNISNKKNG